MPAEALLWGAARLHRGRLSEAWTEQLETCEPGLQRRHDDKQPAEALADLAVRQ